MSELSQGLYRAGAGEQVVLLHGFTGTWHHWRPVLADLVAKYEVIAPSLAGHDGGPPFDKSGPLTLTAAADSLEGHLDDLGVESAHLVGNSMGGALAIELAKRGRALSVVAISPAGGWDEDGREGERLARFFARQVRLLRLTESRLPFVLRSPLRRRLALRDVMRHGEQMPPTQALALCGSALRCDLTKEVIGALPGPDVLPRDLGTITAPVLLAWAQHDRILPAKTCSARLRSGIPGAEFRILPGVGHLPMWDDPQLVGDTIAGWVEQHSKVPAPA